MVGRAVHRLFVGHGFEIIADLIGHPDQLFDLAAAHAARSPAADRSACVKIVAWSPRAIAISVTPLACARSMASEVGAESATSVEAPKIAALATISNEQRLVMTKKPSAGATPLLMSAPINLSSALCRPTSSRKATIAPSRSHQAAPWTARVSALSGCLSSSACNAALTAAGSTGGPLATGDRAAGREARSAMPHRPQPVRPEIARPRARCALMRSPASVTLTLRPLSA